MYRQVALRFASAYVYIADVQAPIWPGAGEQRMWEKMPLCRRYLILYVVPGDECYSG